MKSPQSCKFLNLVSYSSVSLIFLTAPSEFLETYLKKKQNDKPKTATYHWLMSLHDDVESLPQLQKAEFKLAVQKIMLESLQSAAIDNDNVEKFDS